MLLYLNTTGLNNPTLMTESPYVFSSVARFFNLSTFYFIKFHDSGQLQSIASNLPVNDCQVTTSMVASSLALNAKHSSRLWLYVWSG